MNNNKGFSSISTPDGQFRMWIPRPTASGRVIDQDFSILAISFLNAPHECMLKMIEDIPELMEQYLVNT